MKRFFLLGLVTFPLVACGGSSSGNSVTNSNSAAPLTEPVEEAAEEPSAEQSFEQAMHVMCDEEPLWKAVEVL